MTSPPQKLSRLDRLVLNLACLTEMLRQAVAGPRTDAPAPGDGPGQRLVTVWKRSGWQAARLHFLLHHWPRSYRQKVQLKLGRPSLSIFRKYGPLYDLHRPLQSSGKLAAVPPRVKMLLIRNGAIGDVLMLTPVIKALHDSRRGRVQIEVLTHCPQVFRNNPYVHQVHAAKTFAQPVHDYDLVLNFNDVYEHAPQVHPVEVYAHVALGRADFDKQLALYPSPADVAAIAQQVREIGGPYLVVHKPTHEWPNRNLPEDFWFDLLVQLTEKTGWTLVQIGSGRDFAITDHPRMPDMRGQHNLQQLAELIRHSRGFVGVDAGPSHVAASTDAPICTFYTCAHHEVRKPLRKLGQFVPLAANLDCYGCMQRQTRPQPGFECARGDSACVRSFDPHDCVTRILAAINKP